MEFIEITEIIKNSSIDTGNIVFDYLFIGLILFLHVFIWCIDKIVTYPILTAIFLLIAFIFATINRTIKTEIRGNLWKWRR